MAHINFLEGNTLASSIPLLFSTFTGADQLNWHNNVINCFLVIGPTAFYTVKKYKSGVCLQAIKCSRSKGTYKRCPAVQSNWFCFISCVSLVERKDIWIRRMSYFGMCFCFCFFFHFWLNSERKKYPECSNKYHIVWQCTSLLWWKPCGSLWVGFPLFFWWN